MTASRVLTLKYRPARLDELWVQDHVRVTLSRAIESGRLANAYLFTGPRGVGKTTTARILAKSLNCAQGPTVTPCGVCAFCAEIAASRNLDVMEIDGASNRGIEQIRELRENIRYAPSAARFKVYIIDEVHMLTEPAFNALLKTLEEPPAHAKFILATTHAHDLPQTIVSRCQRFDFRKATPKEISDRLAWMAEREGIKATEAALLAIARRADGAIRDAESILDQLSAFRPDGIGIADVEELLGVVPARLYSEYASLIAHADEAGLMRLVAALFEGGYDHVEFLRGAVEHYRKLLALTVGGPEAVESLTAEEGVQLQRQARDYSRARLLAVLAELTNAEDAVRRSQMPRVLLEITSLELAAKCAASPPPAATGKVTISSRPAVPDSDIWAQLRLRVNEHRPMLASALDLAQGAEFVEGTLTVLIPARHKGIASKIEAERGFLEDQLKELAARPTTLKTRLTTTSGPDPVRERVKRIFGEVEERDG